MSFDFDPGRYGIDPARAKELAEAVAASQSDRTETQAVKQARQAVEAAEAHLHKVTMSRGADGRSTYSFEDRSQAERDLAALKKALNTAQNDAARKWREDRDAAAKKEVDDRRAAEQAAFAKEAEASHKEAYHRSYTEAGGTGEQFEKAWPGIWADHLQREATARVENTMAQMRARYGGSF
jgi:rubrerythrin